MLRELEMSLDLESHRDIDIERLQDKFRREEAAREQYRPEYVNSLMEIFVLRDKVNLLFRRKFGFELFKLEHERVLPEIVTACETESDFECFTKSLTMLLLKA